MLNGKPVDALAMIVHRSAAQSIGRAWTKKLSECTSVVRYAWILKPLGDVLPRQLFEVAIQAAIGTKVVARETLSAVRKDVTAGLYGGTSKRRPTADRSGHYERKLKHLNKQKEGKKRLKKLAGNIDIPQSAFFDVLSSRPRTFSTSARQHRPQPEAERLVLDHLPDDLPPPSVDLNSLNWHAAERIPETGPSSLTRSTELAGLHRLLSERPVHHEAIISLFDRVTRSDPQGHIFTAPELRGILFALSKSDKRSRHLRRTKASDISQVHLELDAISQNAHQGIEQAMLASLRSRASVSGPTLAEIEKRMTDLHPRKPSLDNVFGVKRYRACVNYLLQLYALAGDVDRFEIWRSRLASLGVEDDSYSTLAKVTLASQAGDHDILYATLRDMLESVRDSEQQIILINYALWSLAVRYRWDVVLPTYHRLSPTSPRLHVPNVTESEPLPLPSDVRSSPQTFSLLLHSLSHQGYLEAAITVLQTMVDERHQPHVPEYCSLFKGFARHGVVPSTISGRIASSFPLWENLDTPPTVPGQTLSKGQSISQIWQRGVSSRHSGEAADTDQRGWTESALHSIFGSFLQLSPAESRDQAPTPSQTWIILMAFARTTNGNDDVVRGVWDSLEEKFGGEGWWGWRLDGRLRRLRDRMMQ